MGVSSRMARNSLLAAAAAIGVVAAVLQGVAASLSFADFLEFRGFTSLKVASGVEMLGWVFALVAFGVALAGFLLGSRRTRRTVLADLGRSVRRVRAWQRLAAVLMRPRRVLGRRLRAMGIQGRRDRATLQLT